MTAPAGNAWLTPAQRRALTGVLPSVRCPSCNRAGGPRLRNRIADVDCGNCGWSGVVTATFVYRRTHSGTRVVATDVCLRDLP